MYLLCGLYEFQEQAKLINGYRNQHCRLGMWDWLEKSFLSRVMELVYCGDHTGVGTHLIVLCRSMQFIVCKFQKQSHTE